MALYALNSYLSLLTHHGLNFCKLVTEHFVGKAVFSRLYAQFCSNETRVVIGLESESSTDLSRSEVIALSCGSIPKNIVILKVIEWHI